MTDLTPTELMDDDRQLFGEDLLDDDLTQAIAEVKRIATSKTEHMLTPYNEHFTTILNAVASGALIPNADHKLAVAMVVEKAAQSGYVACAETRHVSLGNKVRDTICALIPDDALAEVQALRAANEQFQVMAAEEQRARKAAEAELAATQAKLIEWQSLQHYAYIGRDGKTVLARDLEDRLEATQAKLARLATYEAFTTDGWGFSHPEITARVQYARAALEGAKP